MDVNATIFFVGLYGVIIGMIGGIVLIEMVNRCTEYIEEHPPDDEEEKGGKADGRS